MFSDRVFQITLLISIITHGVIFFQSSNLSLFSSVKLTRNLEVSYVKPLQAPNPAPQTGKKEPFLKLSLNITMQKNIPPPFIDKEGIFKDNRAMSRRLSAITKPAFTKPDIIAIKKKITLPPVGLEKINNPSYVGYYQIVREKIRRAAYYNYSRTDTGEVYVSFVISSDGYLKEARLVEEKSSANQYLREIAVRSVKDASPFPNFPKELDYPQLSFNVVISFEIE